MTEVIRRKYCGGPGDYLHTYASRGKTQGREFKDAPMLEYYLLDMRLPLPADDTGISEITDADIRRLREIANHEDAISWLKEFGSWWTMSAGRPIIELEGVMLSRDSFVSVEEWWYETYRLRRALWLHDFLTDITQESEKFNELCSDLVKVETDDGAFYYCGICWPDKVESGYHLLEEREAEEFFRDPEEASQTSPFVYLWTCLGQILSDGIQRAGTGSYIYYSREDARLIEVHPEEKPCLAAACWDILRQKFLEERPPIRCQICNDLVRAKRSTRMYCDKARCRKAAQRARDKKKTRSKP